MFEQYSRATLGVLLRNSWLSRLLRLSQTVDTKYLDSMNMGSLIRLGQIIKPRDQFVSSLQRPLFRRTSLNKLREVVHSFIPFSPDRFNTKDLLGLGTIAGPTFRRKSDFSYSILIRLKLSTCPESYESTMRRKDASFHHRPWRVYLVPQRP